MCKEKWNEATPLLFFFWLMLNCALLAFWDGKSYIQLWIGIFWDVKSYVHYELVYFEMGRVKFNSDLVHFVMRRVMFNSDLVYFDISTLIWYILRCQLMYFDTSVWLYLHMGSYTLSYWNLCILTLAFSHLFFF